MRLRFYLSDVDDYIIVYGRIKNTELVRKRQGYSLSKMKIFNNEKIQSTLICAITIILLLLYIGSIFNAI